MRIVSSRAVLAILFSPALASADDVKVDVDVDVDVKVRPAVAVAPMAVPAPLPILHGSHWELGLAVEGGQTSGLADAKSQSGFRATIGRQLGVARIALEASIANLDDRMDDPIAQMLRLGLSLRLRAISASRRTEASWYVEGGLAGEALMWSAGGDDERYDLMIGTGFELAGGRDRIGGVELGVRGIATMTDEPGVYRHEMGALLHLGAFFGL